LLVELRKKWANREIESTSGLHTRLGFHLHHASALANPGGATYLSATNWFVEELARGGNIRVFTIGKRRVIDVRDLDAWIDAQSGFKNTKRADAMPLVSSATGWKS
jgi:hypothetical protein